MYACNGIAFNHESERRGYEFVTCKITSTVARIKFGLTYELRLGNLDARRDWGYSPDYVRAMWLMLQQDKPDDYVLATGETHSVQEFVDVAFEFARLSSEDHVVIDQKFYRPAEVNELRGDPSKARQSLGWQVEVRFDRLARLMIETDLALVDQTAQIERLQQTERGAS